jgi:hypothetical protein
LIYDEDNKRLDYLEDEILYGSAGYLYCLLTLRSRLGIRYHQKIDKVIETVIHSLMVEGVQKDKDYLQWTFPRKRGKPYIGAAHGSIGIIYMMIKALQVIPELQRDSDFVALVQNTVQVIYARQSGYGSFPFTLAEDVDEE